MSVQQLKDADPREVGRRLQSARKARGLTQQDAAEHLQVARTTITAIEKGDRRIQPGEFTRLAVFYDRPVSELLRTPSPAAGLAVQLRAARVPTTELTEADLEPYLQEFERLCEDYLELERICQAPLPRRYPSPYEIGALAPERAAEDAAVAERQRLGTGDGPITNLRDVLENDVGLRIFYMDLPSRVSAMFGFKEDLGGCILVNRQHPHDRQRLSCAHEYGHFVSRRHEPEISLTQRYQRVPEHERFADAFARAFLMPASGLTRRYNEIHRSREGRVTPADLCRLADVYAVSFEGMTRRLEELRLLPPATWERLQERGFRVREAQEILGIQPRSEPEQLLPLRYRLFGVEAFQRGDLSEGQFARFLRVDRVEARRLARELAMDDELDSNGEMERTQFELAIPVSELRRA
jgi:Zn-dependent peptidase ImmA (M78 family)/transcriptional regulator with XRE-family HTH domain